MLLSTHCIILIFCFHIMNLSRFFLRIYAACRFIKDKRKGGIDATL